MIPGPWGLRTGDDPFDRRFQVSARHDKFAQQLLTADVRALLMQRDDWVFTMGFDSVACVCAEPFVSVPDVLARLDFLHMLVGALPAEMVHEQTRGLPTLPDGAVVDVTKPEHMRDALLSMTPEQQSTFLDQFEHITPERKAEIMAQVQLHKAGGGP